MKRCVYGREQFYTEFWLSHISLPTSYSLLSNSLPTTLSLGSTTQCHYRLKWVAYVTQIKLL